MADPAPAPARVERSPVWWGTTRTVATRAAMAALLIGGGAVGIWALLPTPQEVTVPDGVLHLSPPAAEAATAAQTPHEVVFVHVAGAVASAGVVELEPGARVLAAIEEAGGPTPESDLSRINLAARVVDGEYLYVPSQGEEPVPLVHPLSERAGTGGPVNLNHASAAQLQELSGIGPVLAERIIAYRNANGPFEQVDDLRGVSGVGPALMSALREHVTV